MDFTIIQRKLFLYLALKHYVETAPSNDLFGLNSSITQKLNPELSNPLHHATEINIDSNSLIKGLTSTYDIAHLYFHGEPC